MIIDPIVQEVRQIRERDAEKHHFNILEIASTIKQQEVHLSKKGWIIKRISAKKAVYIGTLHTIIHVRAEYVLAY